MSESLDIFAAGNPAFMSLVLRAFVLGVEDAGNGPPSLPVLYLVPPFVLSSSLYETFEGTNKVTGFFGWFSRSPEVVVGLAERIRNTAEFCARGILLGCRQGFLSVDENLKVTASKRGLRKNPAWKASDERGRALRDAGRLGAWIGGVGSERVVFATLGVCP